MVRITESMIRKRAEHNEGMISTLEEVSLHQQEIERIEHLDKWCRELRIVYLQNNLIQRIENVARLKMLEYLNLALNAIKRIEGLTRCESLKKLDLTVNFIDVPEGLLSVAELSANEKLEDLYLTGNPCTSYEGYREFVVASLPSLQRLDGTDVVPSERIAATQRLEAIRMDLEAMRDAGVRGVDIRDEGTYNYTAEERLADHAEEVAKKEADAEAERKAKKPTPWDSKAKPRREGFDELPEDLNSVYQKNEGEWDFTLRETEDGKALALEVMIGKFMDTSLVDIDVRPSLVRLLIKGKLLQLKLEADVCSDRASAQRSKVSGALLLTMPLADPEKAVLSVQGRTRPKDSGDSSAAAVVASRAAPVGTAAVVEAVGSSDSDADEPPLLDGVTLA